MRETACLSSSRPCSAECACIKDVLGLRYISGGWVHQVVPYCTVGYRSGKYAEALQKEGFQVANLACSILGWVCPALFGREGCTC